MDILVWWDFVWRLDCQYDGSQNPRFVRSSSYYGGQPTAEEAEQIKRPSWRSMPV
jgi:hypothetical protein